MDYTISITNKCNLKCSYCYERHLNTEYGSISDETREKIKEISAELFMIKIGARNMDDPDILDKALFGIIRQLDNLAEN